MALHEALKPGQKLKIAHIATIYGTVVGILATKISTLNAFSDLEVTSLSAPPPNYPQLPVCLERHIPFPIERSIRPWADLNALLSLYRILRRERFDIVHTHTAKAGFIGALAAWMARVPVIVHTTHGLPFFEGQPALPYYAYKLGEWIACRFRDVVMTQNRSDIAPCTRLMGSPERVFLEGNGVDVETVRAAAERDRSRGDADFPSGALRLVMLSRLEPVKRVGDFIAMCDQLAREGLDFSAVIAGYGPQEKQLRRNVDERGLSDRVRLLGWAPHATALLAASDIVFLTSEKEGIPRSLMEAMALGKPVIATDVVGTRELVVNGVTGYLVPLGQPEALAGKVRLMADPAIRQRLGKAGKVRVEEEFNDIKIAAFLRRKYFELVIAP